MDDITARLDQFLDLPPDQQRALAAEIRASHPEVAPQLGELQRLQAALDAAAGRGAHADEALAYQAARDHVEGHTRTDLRPEHFATDADLRHQFFGLRDYVETLDRQLADPLAQFEALTGHRVDELEPRVIPLHPSRQAAARQPVRHARPAARQRFTQYALAACFALVALYGGLAIASRASQTELDRLAALDTDALAAQVAGGTVRGAENAPASNDARYLAALDALGDARRTTLGLFPHYDAPALQAVKAQLETVVQDEPDGSFLQLEASYALGKTLLLLGDTDAAQPHFLRVVEYGGREADAAARILATLATRGV